MKTLFSLPVIAALALTAAAPAMALPQPLSPAGVLAPATSQPVQLARRGRGADDGPNHDAKDDHGRRGRGRDDGRRHG